MFLLQTISHAIVCVGVVCRLRGLLLQSAADLNPENERTPTSDCAIFAL